MSVSTRLMPGVVTTLGAFPAASFSPNHDPLSGGGKQTRGNTRAGKFFTRPRFCSYPRSIALKKELEV
jgi:hypothetical protein